MAEVGDDLLRFVEPVMDRLIVFDLRRPICGRWTARGDRDVPWSPPSKIVAVVGGIAEPLVEIEVDAALADIEPECAVGAVVVFPAAMGLGEVVVAEGLDGVVEADRCGS